MGEIISLRVAKYQKHFELFYSTMDSRSLKDLIEFSYNQGDFTRPKDPFETARLRALLKKSRDKIQDSKYIEDLVRLERLLK